MDSEHIGINYVFGDATQPKGYGNKFIVHCCNNIGKWGAGFVLQLGNRFPSAKKSYLEWFRKMRHPSASGPMVLGEIQLIDNASDIYVINLIGQRGTGYSNGLAPIRYCAIRSGFSKVREIAITNNASIHMPRMGSGLAGGDWNIIEKIVKEEFIDHNISVTVYDLPS